MLPKKQLKASRTFLLYFSLEWEHARARIESYNKGYNRAYGNALQGNLFLVRAPDRGFILSQLRVDQEEDLVISGTKQGAFWRKPVATQQF